MILVANKSFDQNLMPRICSPTMSYFSCTDSSRFFLIDIYFHKELKKIVATNIKISEDERMFRILHKNDSLNKLACYSKTLIRLGFTRARINIYIFFKILVPIFVYIFIIVSIFVLESITHIINFGTPVVTLAAAHINGRRRKCSA